MAAERARADAERQVREAEQAQRVAVFEEAVEQLDAALLAASNLGEQIADELIAGVESLKVELIQRIAGLVRLGDRLNRAESEVRATHAEATRAAREAGLPAPPDPKRPGSRVHDRPDDVGQIAQAATFRRAGLSPGEYVLRELAKALLGGHDIGHAE
jgi:hypothetical protein